MSEIIVSVLYTAAQIFSDIGSLRIVNFFGFSIDAGTFIYPITYTLRDLVHKKAGKKVAQTLIFVVAGLNLFMAFFFWFVSILPADIVVGPQREFGAVLSPVWRIVIASIISEVISELVDTEIYHFWVTKVTTKYQWLRVLVSNAFSVPVDSVIFSFLAFLGSFPFEVVVSIILSNIIIKYATTLISLPLIYTVNEKNLKE
ncbi:MAG TPA: queuosine precursor transporter [Ignavibacteriales bacterium]|mgnify:FL=1|nr:queuosine precursor transporter [Ignavibacteriales bacterium]HPD67684.1 queuosine precursor transporter [Ignavibacteriales bacterium]HPP34158.1 queuosine precursor transporter [Ignavibacteriales bacterium]HRR19212.1 queuosine precursor transporter [Ignavibacteriales bacterium]HRT98676.1 queuosine precursor transporter [Ignavibacteriales bacterium]